MHGQPLEIMQQHMDHGTGNMGDGNMMVRDEDIAIAQAIYTEVLSPDGQVLSPSVVESVSIVDAKEGFSFDCLCIYVKIFMMIDMCFFELLCLNCFITFLWSPS